MESVWLFGLARHHLLVGWLKYPVEMLPDHCEYYEILNISRCGEIISGGVIGDYILGFPSLVSAWLIIP